MESYINQRPERVSNPFRVILLALLLVITNSTIAQPGKWKEKGEKIEALKVAYITQELDLSPKEAQVFWPVYNQMEAELKVIRKDKWSNRLGAGAMIDLDILTDAEIEEALTAEFDATAKEHAIRRKYFGEFKKVLPMRKVALLYRAEERFKLKLLEELRKRKEGHQ